jgi:hypothetical protein
VYTSGVASLLAPGASSHSRRPLTEIRNCKIFTALCWIFFYLAEQFKISWEHKIKLFPAKYSFCRPLEPAIRGGRSCPPFLFPTHTSIHLSSLFVNCLSRTHDPRRKLSMSKGIYLLCNAYLCLLVSLAARISAVCHDERRDSPILPPERSCQLHKREMYYSRLVNVSRLGFLVTS